jgi:superfamily II DNA or RNA helicase
VASLTAGGHLVPSRYFSVTEPDLERVRTVAGDYNTRDLDAAVNRPGLVGDVVSHWLRLAPERRTAVFCTSVAHSVAVAEAFMRAGVAAEHVDASTPTGERESTFQRFTDGTTQVLTNCFLASYGFDLPALSCVVLARPTKSLMLFLQMVGRGLRTAPGKADCLVLDHSGAVHLHGFAHEPRDWTLDGNHELAARGPGGATERGERKRVTCPECRAVFTGTTTCPECGYRIPPRARDVDVIDGELVEVGEHQAHDIDRKAFYRELRALQAERNYSPRWAAAQFRERFGTWPPFAWNDVPTIEPTIATRRWVKAKQIAYAKSRAGAQA